MSILIPSFIYFLSVLFVQDETESGVGILRHNRRPATTFIETSFDFGEQFFGLVAATQDISISTSKEISNNSRQQSANENPNGNVYRSEKVSKNVNNVDLFFLWQMVVFVLMWVFIMFCGKPYDTNVEHSR